MAAQKAILEVQGDRSGRFQIRISITDVDAAACTFTDIGGATTYVAPENLVVVSATGQGTTAPAAVTAIQANINGADRMKFMDIAALYNKQATLAERLGAFLGAQIPQGTALRLIQRA